jgi:homoserine dehydrogenase
MYLVSDGSLDLLGLDVKDKIHVIMAQLGVHPSDYDLSLEPFIPEAWISNGLSTGGDGTTGTEGSSGSSESGSGCVLSPRRPSHDAICEQLAEHDEEFAQVYPPGTALQYLVDITPADTHNATNNATTGSGKHSRSSSQSGRGGAVGLRAGGPTQTRRMTVTASLRVVGDKHISRCLIDNEIFVEIRSDRSRIVMQAAGAGAMDGANSVLSDILEVSRQYRGV